MDRGNEGGEGRNEETGGSSLRPQDGATGPPQAMAWGEPRTQLNGEMYGGG